MSHRIRFACRALIAAALTAVAALAPISAAPAAEVPLPASPAADRPERVVVVWEDDAGRPARVDARADADATLVRTLGDPQFQLLQPEPGQSTAEAVEALRDDPAVRAVTPDVDLELHATPNDPLFDQLWGLFNSGAGIAGFPALAGADIDAPAAWDRTRGIPSVIVAIIDSGTRISHPDLGPVTWTNPADPQNGVDDDRNGIVDDTRGADFVGADANRPAKDGDPTDVDVINGGHGLHVAGTAAAAGNDGVGITGVAQDVRIMPLRVCGLDARDLDSDCPFSSMIDAINYAGSHGARVANLSLGARAAPDLAEVLAFAANPGTLFVVSAGNNAQDNEVHPHTPCTVDPTSVGGIDNVVCVAATSQTDQLAGFSNWGARSVDLAAPGTQTLSAYMWGVDMNDPFTVNDFAAKWSATGGGGFSRTNESPLTTFGISDSPGRAPVAGSVVESTSAPVTLPAGFPHCRLLQERSVNAGGGTYAYEILLDGQVLDGFSSSSNSLGTFFFDVTSGSRPRLALGGSLQVRFRYTAGPAPVLANGVWLDNISLRCADPVGATNSYGFLNGTSMASPHVAGAAALLYSLKPSATVAEVRGALLSSVDPVPALAGKTVTGGRLNVARALDVLVPPAPPAPPPAPPAPPIARTAAVRCVVPRLRGLSLRRARAALTSARCRLGRVTRPRARRGRRLPPLVVRSSRPGRGALLAEDASVAVTLKVKPPRRARRRARRRR